MPETFQLQGCAPLSSALRPRAGEANLLIGGLRNKLRNGEKTPFAACCASLR
jgi:hypothetical protein